jgi:phenylacetaldehyde dehydrogenase
VAIYRKVSDFISRSRKMLIGGKWVEAASGKTFPAYNPATGEVITQLAEGNKKDVDQAVKAAREGFESGSLA